MRRYSLLAAGLLAIVLLAACGRADTSERYCQIVVGTHDSALGARGANASGVARSDTAVPSIQAQRSAAAPAEIEEEWSTVTAGPSMESDGPDGTRKEDAYRAAVATIERYDQSHCGVTPDIAPRMP